MRLTTAEREAMIGRSYQSDMNNPDEMKTTVLDVRRNAGGFTVVHQHGSGLPQVEYTGLSEFLKSYKYELRDYKYGDLSHE